MMENVLAMNLHISARVPMGSQGIVVRSELPLVSLFMSLVWKQLVRTCGTCYDDP